MNLRAIFVQVDRSDPSFDRGTNWALRAGGDIRYPCAVVLTRVIGPVCACLALSCRVDFAKTVGTPSAI